MKRIILIILAFVYLGASQGPTVYLHYCMGELVETGLEHPGESAACEFCGMSKSAADAGACCQQDAKSIKIDNVQKIVKSEYKFDQKVIFLPKMTTEHLLHTFNKKGLKASFSQQDSRPRWQVPLVIEHCTYRI